MSPRKKPSRRLVRTAYHEAGHATVAFKCGLSVKGVSIRPSGDAYGTCRYVHRWLDFDPSLDSSLRTRDRIERLAMASLGGVTAERIYTDRHIRAGAESDISRAIDLLGYVTSGPDEIRAYMNWMLIRTRNLLGAPGNWTLVNQLVEQLLDDGELGERRLRRFLREQWQAMASER